MRIIGGKDYYDSGMAWGLDETIVFLRNRDIRMTDREVHDSMGLERRRPTFHFATASRYSRMIFDAHRVPNENVEYEGADGQYSMRPAHVVLCGVLRSGILVHRSHVNCWPSRASEDHWIWSEDAFRSFAEKHGLGIVEGHDDRRRDSQFDKACGMIHHDVELLSLSKWFEPKELTGRARETILVNRITILSYNPDAVRWENRETPWAVDQSGLGDMGFAKAMDPVTAFQEISMWKSGVLGSDGPVPVRITDDRIKAEKHGFHHPTSFRRAKEKHR